MSALDALAPVKGASPGPAPWRALKPGLSRNRCTQWPQGCWRPSPRGIKSSIVDGHATLARLLGNLHNLHKLKKQYASNQALVQVIIGLMLVHMISHYHAGISVHSGMY